MKNRYLILLIAGLMITMFSCKKDNDGPDYPTNGLVSYFAFDGDLTDEMGNCPDGIVNGGVTYTDGVRKQAMTLNGIDQYISFGRESFSSGLYVSTSLWFKTSSAAVGSYFIICHDFAVGVGLSHVHYAISTPVTNTANGAYADDTWTHMVGTYDGSNIRIYVNGILDEVIYHPGTLMGPDVFLTIGFYSGNWFNGSIDELFIYDAVLSQEDVTALYDR